MNYYNDTDPFVCEWMLNLMGEGLIPMGYIDNRPIEEVQPYDLKGFVQCHWFAGICGWPLALERAGWPADQPIWTGSCPCPSFSAAGKHTGFDDPRHLWTEWFRLIAECRPPVLFGEQVEAAIGHGWLDLVQLNLEGEGYAVGACVLGAHSVGAPHRRQRLYFVADTQGAREGAVQQRGQLRIPEPGGEDDGSLAHAPDPRHDHARQHGGRPSLQSARPVERGATEFLADPTEPGRFARGAAGEESSGPEEVERLGRLRATGRLEHAAGDGRLERRAEPSERGAGARCASGELAHPECSGWQGTEPAGQDTRRETATAVGRGSAHDSGTGGVGDSSGAGLPARQREAVEPEGWGDEGRAALQRGGPPDEGRGRPGPVNGFWRDADWIRCTDGRWRATQPGLSPLAVGTTGRVGKLRAYGNSLCVPAAEAFVRAYLGK